MFDFYHTDKMVPPAEEWFLFFYDRWVNVHTYHLMISDYRRPCTTRNNRGITSALPAFTIIPTLIWYFYPQCYKSIGKYKGTGLPGIILVKAMTCVARLRFDVLTAANRRAFPVYIIT